MTLENKIDRFWKWFAQNEGDVVRAVDDEILAESIVEQLDNFILDMGAFSWEIGAGIEKNWFLTISPNENEKQKRVDNRREQGSLVSDFTNDKKQSENYSQRTKPQTLFMQ